MKVVKKRDYPVWVCYPCGDKHGFKKCGIATWHKDKCGVCCEVTAVTEPRDFGHLKNSWMKAYAHCAAIEEYLNDVLVNAEVDVNKDNLNTTTPMNKKERIKRWTYKIDKIVGTYKQITAVCDEARAIGCLDMDGKLYLSIWMMFDVMLDQLDQGDWLGWYIYENDCGAAKMNAGFDEVVNPIKNSRDLAKLIVEGEDRDDR